MCIFKKHKFKRQYDLRITESLYGRHVECEKCKIRYVILWVKKEFRVHKSIRFKENNCW